MDTKSHSTIAQTAISWISLCNCFNWLLNLGGSCKQTFCTNLLSVFKGNMPLSRSSCLSDIVMANLKAAKTSDWRSAISLERSAWILFTVANLHYQLSWWNQVISLYSLTDAVPQFLWKLPPFIFEWRPINGHSFSQLFVAFIKGFEKQGILLWLIKSLSLPQGTNPKYFFTIPIIILGDSHRKPGFLLTWHAFKYLFSI